MANLLTTQNAILDALYLPEKPSQLNQLSLPANITIYQHAYFVRLHNALANNFPSLFNYLTDEDFSKLANHYIKNNPSQHFNLQCYGSDISYFVSKHNYPAYYSELCLFDSCIQKVGALPVAQHQLTVNNFKTIVDNYGDKIMIQLSPTVRLMTLKYNLLEIIASSYNSKVMSSNDRVVVFQKNFKVYYKKLTNQEYDALKKCNMPRLFNDFWVDMEFYFSGTAVKIFQQWLADNLLCYSSITK